MKKLDRSERCPKCESPEPPKLRWLDAGPSKATPTSAIRDRPERIRVECTDCGFSWTRAPLDVTERKLTPNETGAAACSDSAPQNSASSR